MGFTDMSHSAPPGHPDGELFYELLGKISLLSPG